MGSGSDEADGGGLVGTGAEGDGYTEADVVGCDPSDCTKETLSAETLAQSISDSLHMLMLIISGSVLIHITLLNSVPRYRVIIAIVEQLWRLEHRSRY